MDTFRPELRQMLRALPAKLPLAVSFLSGTLAFVLHFKSETDYSSKLDFLFFAIDKFAGLLILVLVVVATVALIWFLRRSMPQLRVWQLLRYGLRPPSKLEGSLAVSLLLLIALVGSGVVVADLWPSIKLTGVYLRDGRLAGDYRRIFLIRAFGAEYAGNYEEAIDKYLVFQALFPEHAKANDIDTRVTKIKKNIADSASTLEMAAKTAKLTGFSQAILNERIAALELHPASKDARDAVRSSVETAMDFGAKLHILLGRCETNEGTSNDVTEEILGEALVALGMENSPAILVGTGTIDKKYKTFCRIVASEDKEAILARVERLWRLNAVKSYIGALAPGRREARKDQFVAAAVVHPEIVPSRIEGLTLTIIEKITGSSWTAAEESADSGDDTSFDQSDRLSEQSEGDVGSFMTPAPMPIGRHFSFQTSARVFVPDPETILVCFDREVSPYVNLVIRQRSVARATSCDAAHTAKRFEVHFDPKNEMGFYFLEAFADWAAEVGARKIAASLDQETARASLCRAATLLATSNGRPFPDNFYDRRGCRFEALVFGVR